MGNEAVNNFKDVLSQPIYLLDNTQDAFFKPIYNSLADWYKAKQILIEGLSRGASDGDKPVHIDVIHLDIL
jgi:hypothetical protein